MFTNSPPLLIGVNCPYPRAERSEVEDMDVLQSFLFVPADSPRKMASARNLHPDAFIYDLEDAVPIANKHEARHLLTGELNSFINPRPKIFIRVNGFGSAFFGDDLRAVVRREVSGIVLPKCNDASQIAQVHQELSRLENRMSMPEASINVIPILESAKGVSLAGEIARSSSRIIALFFGGEDFCADMGITRSKDGDEIGVARSLVALAAKSERLEAIDGPFTDFHDRVGLFEETRRVKKMGFTGKALIHPNQIETVHQAMAPSDEQIALAQEIVSAFENAGSGVTAVRGKMIDEPVVAQARKVLKQRARERKA
jgi:citrate lyase subunit beta / citryl-CoA lyase